MNLLDMSVSNVIDLVVFFLLVVLCVKGAFRGLSGEIFSILGTVGGIILAWKFTRPISETILSKTSLHPAFVFIATMVLLYISVAILAALVCKGVKKIIRFTNLSMLDRTLGVAAGVLKTVAIVLFIYIVSGSFSTFLPSQWFSDSVTIKVGAYLWPGVESFLVQMHIWDPEMFIPSI